MKDIRTRRLEVLDWEKNNRNSNNRSILPPGKGCTYVGEIGCAVGRLIEDKGLCARLDAGFYSAISHKEVFCQIPESVQELGRDFLSEMQMLHDDIGYWTEEGLSEQGLERYEKIKKEYCTDES